jgi:hypothetical protein
MNPLVKADVQDPEIARAFNSDEGLEALQQHLQEVIEGAAFRRSPRSGQFLKYIVGQAIAGNFDCLKERVIGMELWGKSSSYHTSEDAIVRVTAAEVRKRLVQHYNQYDTAPEFRITLPVGSYVPEISRRTVEKPALLHGAASADTELPVLTVVPQAPAKSEGTGIDAGALIVPAIEPVLPESEPAPQREKFLKRLERSRIWPFRYLLLNALGLAALLTIVWLHFFPRTIPLPSTTPWSVLLNSAHPLHVITSDPDMAQVEEYMNGKITLSRYANHHYFPDPDNLDPDRSKFLHYIFNESESSPTDIPIVVDLQRLAQTYGKQIDLHNARKIQFSDLQNDDNFVLLGSPLSDPWSDFFSDQLDFRFGWDADQDREYIENVHPRPNEMTQYVPGALGWQTGQSYATIAFIQNPDQRGHVLLIGGASAEGTEAVEKLLVDIPRLDSVLKGCGINSKGPIQNFEILFRLNMMAGSPNHLSVEACHILGEAPARSAK